MTNKSKSLEEFVENYIKNKARASSGESYADWLISNGVAADKIYSDRIKDIGADYIRAKSEYGTTAEKLSNLGLGSSGYSDYIGGKAYSEMQKSKIAARNSYNETAEKNAAGYQEYLRKYTERENESYERIVGEITEKGIIDYTTAYNYAVGAGLGSDIAKAAAKTASDINRTKLKESIIKTVMSEQLTSTQAKQYALQLGLDEEDAKEIADYAGAANEYVSTGGYTDADYLKDLKEKIKNTKKN